MPFDTKRINGPDSSSSYLDFAKKATKAKNSVKDDTKETTRPLCKLKVSLICQKMDLSNLDFVSKIVKIKAKKAKNSVKDFIKKTQDFFLRKN